MASPNQPSSPADTEPSPRRTPQNTGPDLAARAVNAMAAKKAQDVTIIDLREISNMADFFVVGSGESDRQVRAIANGVIDRIEEECEERPWKKEGMDHGRWVLLDYVDLVVHVFLPDRRDHYRIERLWGEADRETVPEDGTVSDVELLQELLNERPDED